MALILHLKDYGYEDWLFIMRATFIMSTAQKRCKSWIAYGLSKIGKDSQLIS